MYKNYRPNVPDEFQSDELYAEPSVEVWVKVKTEDGNGLGGFFLQTRLFTTTS